MPKGNISVMGLLQSLVYFTSHSEVQPNSLEIFCGNGFTYRNMTAQVDTLDSSGLVKLFCSLRRSTIQSYV